MKKVILINFTGKTGGGPIGAYEMAKALLENGKKIVGVISDGCCNIEEWKELPLEELVLLHTYHDKKTLIKNSIRFYIFGDKRLKGLSKKYDISYIYCPMFSLWTRMVNRKISRKIRICVVNHDPVPHSGEKSFSLMVMNLFGMQAQYKEADTIVVHSHAFVKYVEQKYHKEGNVLYFPFGRQQYIKYVENKKQYNFYDEKKVNFLFFGRIEAYKGIGILLDAYEKVLENCSNVSLTIVGSGDCRAYEKQIAQLKVYLINRWISDEEIGSFFRGKNLVLVLPYLDATQSGSVLVALEYGIPTICSDTGGLREQVRDGETGVLVPSGDSKKLSEIMTKVAVQDDYRESLSKGIPKMLEKLEWTRLAKMLDRFMERDLNN